MKELRAALTRKEPSPLPAQQRHTVGREKDVGEPPKYSVHHCVENYGRAHRMCLFKRVCRRDKRPSSDPQREFTYYTRKGKNLALSMRSNGIMRTREQKLAQPVRLWTRHLDQDRNKLFDPTFHYEEEIVMPDGGMLATPIVLVHAFVPVPTSFRELSTVCVYSD